MKNLSYVRTEMLPEQAPPVGETGIIRWMRENLFSGWMNSILTILGLVAVYFILLETLPWALDSTWNAGSLNECRENAPGACWAVIHERFPQLVFGFYPNGTDGDPDQRWRIIVAFVLLLVAVAPVLFDKLPRKMLAFSAIYPFFGYWLLWGGTIWGPLTAIAGFVIAYIVYRILAPMAGNLVAVVVSILTPIVWWLFLAGPIAGALGDVAPIGLMAIPSSKFGGLALSVIIGVAGIALSFPIGVLLALGRQSNLFIIKTLSVAYIEFIRGVPLITLLFVASVLLNYFLPPGTNFDIILRVVIMVTLFSAAYMAEVIRGGLAALPRGQYEAADALGLDYWKANRLIIMPQALKIAIPGIVGTFIGLFKDTTLVSIIGLMDPLALTNAIRADQDWNGIVWELYLFVALMFWVFTFFMSRYSMYLERKLQTGH